MAQQQEKTFVVEDAEIRFRNFAGHPSTFNRDGDRNFSVILPDDVAEQMLADGWAVKWLQPREEGDEPQAHIKVTVKFGFKNPRVVLITEKSRTQLEEKDLAMLDSVDIKSCDVMCRSYYWEMGDKSGIAAYLKTLIVTILEDPLEKKYNLHGEPPTHAED